MTLVINSYSAFVDLPKRIEHAIRQRDMAHTEYAEKGSRSGYTKHDLADLTGMVWGMKQAMACVLQEHWCAKNDHPVPMATLDDVESYLREIGVVR